MTDQMLTGPTSRFTPNEDADRLVREDPFAFLLAVISDMGIRAEVAYMVAVARALHPERPGELDLPAWDIGRRWCRPAPYPRRPDPISAVFGDDHNGLRGTVTEAA